MIEKGFQYVTYLAKEDKNHDTAIQGNKNQTNVQKSSVNLILKQDFSHMWDRKLRATD